MVPLDFVLFLQVFCLIHQYHLIVKSIIAMVEEFMKEAHAKEDWEAMQVRISTKCDYCGYTRLCLA